MKIVAGAIVLVLAGAVDALAVPCGTLAAPTPCSITVGNITFTVSDFQFGTSNASGGGTAYAADDVSIILSDFGSIAALTFSEAQLGAGLDFAVTAGQASAFNFTYDITISAAVPGTVSYDTPFLLNFTLAETTGNGAAATQLIVPGAPVCQRTTIGGNSTACAIPAQGSLTINNVGMALSLVANTGTAGVAGFFHTINADFTAAAPVPALPAPAMVLLVTAIIAVALSFMRRRRRAGV
jgi:hypothetical protein